MKLRDDAATHEWPSPTRTAERLVRVFEAAAERHPSIEVDAARAVIAATLGDDRAPSPGDEVLGLPLRPRRPELGAAADARQGAR